MVDLDSINFRLTAEPAISTLVDHLFRHEAGKIVSVLTKLFGPGNISLAEDVVQDSLVEAMEHWQYGGIPDNPSAWLFRVARNKAINLLNREKYGKAYRKHAAHVLKSDLLNEPSIEQLFSEQEIRDDQLRMIFTCCHPCITPDSQIALALKTLCGFSIPEIARAFLTNEETIHKRLTRARQSIRDAKAVFDIPRGKDLVRRLDAVLGTIYLLFNEGYSASKGDDIIRYQLCEEAIRLAELLLTGRAIGEKDTVHALLALMMINASRFKARQDDSGNLLTLEEQDRSLWDTQLINDGLAHLAAAAENDRISVYHIHAAISATYAIAADYASTDWQGILALYDSLLQLDDSPIVFLNRAIVVAKALSIFEALTELKHLKTPA